MEKPTVVDLFCGAGGLSEGFRMAGFEVVLAIEADATAAATYKKNNPKTELIIDDIRNISSEMILAKTRGRKINVLIGGPPCQGFSTANTRRHRSDDRNRLYEEFLRIVYALEPDFFVMENVRGIISAKATTGKLVIEEIRDSVSPIYKVEHKLLMAADYGVPQIRRRAFIVGRKGDGKILFPDKTHAPNTRKEKKTGLKEWASVRKILLPKKKVPKKLFYSKKMIAGFKRREKLNRKRDLGFHWQFLDRGKPSYTIPARYYKDGANALVKYSNSEIRMLDTIECAKIQTFPASYVFVGSKRQIYRQIGNAVPPLMAHRVAETVLEMMSC